MDKSKISTQEVKFVKTVNHIVYNDAGYKIMLDKILVYDNNISIFFKTYYNGVDCTKIYLDKLIIDGIQKENCLLDLVEPFSEDVSKIICLNIGTSKKEVKNSISFILNLQQEEFSDNEDYFCDFSSSISIDILKKEQLVKINGKLSIDDRLNVLEAELDNIIHKLNNANKQESNDIKDYKINFADFVVKCNVFKCNANHEIEQVQAVVDIMTPSGNIISEKISAGYCLICKCYFILETDYNHLREKGILLCQQLTYEAYRKNGLAIMNGEELKPESLLHQSGYNVSANDDLSSNQRQEILRRVVDNGLYTISGICSHLDWLIGRNNKVRNRDMSSAIAKWKEDRMFISNYNVDKQRKVKINSLSVKNYDLPF